MGHSRSSGAQIRASLEARHRGLVAPKSPPGSGAHLSGDGAQDCEPAIREGRLTIEWPWFPLYVNDFIGDEVVATATNEELGAYMRLLCHQWIEGSLPADLGRLARVARADDATFQRIWPHLEHRFTHRNGRLMNPRLERERRQTVKRYAGFQRGGKAAQAKLKASPEASPGPSSEAGYEPTTETLHSKHNTTSSTPPGWVQELASCWKAAYGGRPSFPQLGRFLKPLVVADGLEAVRVRWEAYLKATDARYASPARFSQTYGSWGSKKATGLRDAYLTAAEMQDFGK